MIFHSKIQKFKEEINIFMSVLLALIEYLAGWFSDEIVNRIVHEELIVRVEQF